MIVKKIQWLAALCFLFPITAFSNDLPVSVQLVSIQSVKPSEIGGDEVYFSVTQFNPNDTIEYYTIPERPLHWPSKILNKIKDLPLWKGTLAKNHGIEIVFSVIDHDMPPLNPDDLLGSIKLKLKNDEGKLIATWKNLDNKSEPETITSDKGTIKRFILTGDDSKYIVDLMVVEKANAK